MSKRFLSMAAMGAALLALPLTASAEMLGLSVGGRVGGYGFRQQSDSGERSRWDACRMNGIGVFAQKTLRGPLFVEAGLDSYFSEDFPVGADDSHDQYETPLDRLSALTTIAAGVRMFPRAIVSPYLQLGIGAEMTRVRAPKLDLEDSQVLPMGFFGLGAEIHASKRISLGANLRVNLMGYFKNDALMTELDAEPEIAAQGQFYAKVEL